VPLQLQKKSSVEKFGKDCANKFNRKNAFFQRFIEILSKIFRD